jgi:putative hydrolase of the HAD superfamily
MVQVYKNEAILFDLDDLLYKEFDFMRSGFWSIAKMIDSDEPKRLFRMMMAQYFLGNKVLDWLCKDYLGEDKKVSFESLLTVYRDHKPDISLTVEARDLLDALKKNGNKIGILTDGRSITQRNKIEALHLNRWVDLICISEECGFEKPSQEPFLQVMSRMQCERFVYMADNFNKDFVAPNKLGWRTIALLDNGLNIHIKRNDLTTPNYPNQTITNLSEIEVKSTLI